MVISGKKTFQYNFTHTKLTKRDIDISNFNTSFKPVVINQVKTSPDLKIGRANKVTIAFNYKDKNGVFVEKILVTPVGYQ